MLRATILLVGAALLPFVASSQELLVFPAVTDEAPGLHDSLWVTVVRVVKLDPQDTVTLRRKWVCLPGGGFVDDLNTGPVWQLQGNSQRLAVIWGGDLLVGTDASTGAVALEIEGGAVLAHARVVDVLRGLYGSGSVAFGQGQLTPALRDPLSGASHIPWLGGCLNSPCALTPPVAWNYLRNNIGMVNPNPETLTLRGTVIPIAPRLYPPLWRFDEVWDDPPETFEVRVPPYGWLQFPWSASHRYEDPAWGALIPTEGFVVSLTPEPDLPYYAYASVVFTPDPESGVPLFSDPMYVPAEPGYVVPFAEAAFPQ